jgi:hypothetical protein
VTRILHVGRPAAPKMPRKVTGTGATDRISGSKHDAAQLVGRVKGKASIRRLRAVANTAVKDMVPFFTNNPNPKFDPSQAPGSVQIKKVPKLKPISGDRNDDRGHMKVFHPNRQTLFGGKTLRRKQF